jgi:hypothetical protein
MTDGCSGTVPRPGSARGRWNSFLSNGERGPCEAGNPRHRVRVEYDGHTVLIHLSDEDGAGWTTVAVDRRSRGWSVAQRDGQRAAASSAVRALYGESG